MKRISFKDSQGLNLTQMVLTGRKTMTRRNTRMYEVGDLVAIQQPYREIVHECAELHDILLNSDGQLNDEFRAGWNNKMFVRAGLMPHHIRITALRQERLQDISDDDCLREGLYFGQSFFGTHWMTSYYMPGDKEAYQTPREAFASFIDKISGRGTWKSDPMVFVYEFELVD